MRGWQAPAITVALALTVAVVGSPITTRERARIAQLTLKHRIPAIGPLNHDGLLLGYGARLAPILRRAAEMTDKVLKGQPTSRSSSRRSSS